MRNYVRACGFVGLSALLACVPVPRSGGRDNQAGDAVLTGLVERTGGRPVSQAVVRLERDGRLVSEIVTGADGTFAFPGLAAGPHSLRVTKGDEFTAYDFTQRNGRPLDPGQFPGGRYFLRVEVRGRPTVVRGKVVALPQQTPVAGAKVWTYPPTVETNTDAAGSFVLESEQFEEGPDFKVSIQHPDMTPRWVSLDRLKLAQQNDLGEIGLNVRPQDAPVEQEPLPPPMEPGINGPGDK